MKTVKIQLLYLLIIVSFIVNSETLKFKTSTDIANKIKIDSGSSWAVNGGIFKPIVNGIYIKQAGSYQLLLKNTDGVISHYDLIISGESVAPANDNLILIDKSGPVIEINWNNVISHDKGVIVGANSRLNWSIKANENVDQKVLINDKLIQIKKNSVTFNQDSSTVSIIATDYFGNKTINKHDLISDFDGPELRWELSEPAIKKDGQWIAGKKAEIIYHASDVSGINHYLLNNKKLAAGTSTIVANNGSELTVVDNFANKTSTTLNWQLDNKKPIIKVKIDDEVFTNKRRFKVKTDQHIQVSVEDEGIGLKNAIYYSTNHTWESLPQTFIFLKRGRNSVLIIAEDKFGNKLKTKLKFRAMSSGE